MVVYVTPSDQRECLLVVSALTRRSASPCGEMTKTQVGLLSVLTPPTLSHGRIRSVPVSMAQTCFPMIIMQSPLHKIYRGGLF